MSKDLIDRLDTEARATIDHMLDALLHNYSDKLYDSVSASASTDFEAEIYAIRKALAAAPQPALLEHGGPAGYDDWIKRHSRLVADCSGASTVVLASSLRRFLARSSTPQAQQAQPLSEADPFTYIIQHLNSSPYALTKDECITKIKDLRAIYQGETK